MLAVLLTTYWLRWKSHTLSKNVFRMGLGFIAIAMILGGYSTYRHLQNLTEFGDFEEGLRNLALLPQAVMNASFLTTGDEGGTAESSLVAIHLYTKERPPEPFFTIKLLIFNPIPRDWWPGKPVTLGASLPHSIGRWKYGYVNWGPGIVGHGYHEGGLVMLVFYGFLFGFCLRFFDEVLFRQQDNPYVLAMLGAISGQVIALSRGDIVVFGMLIIGPVLGILMLAFVARCFFGIGLTYLPSNPRSYRKPAGCKNS